MILFLTQRLHKNITFQPLLKCNDPFMIFLSFIIRYSFPCSWMDITPSEIIPDNVLKHKLVDWYVHVIRIALFYAFSFWNVNKFTWRNMQKWQHQDNRDHDSSELMPKTMFRRSEVNNEIFRLTMVSSSYIRAMRLLNFRSVPSHFKCT